MQGLWPRKGGPEVASSGPVGRQAPGLQPCLWTPWRNTESVLGVVSVAGLRGLLSMSVLCASLRRFQRGQQRATTPNTVNTRTSVGLLGSGNKSLSSILGRRQCRDDPLDIGDTPRGLENIVTLQCPGDGKHLYPEYHSN